MGCVAVSAGHYPGAPGAAFNGTAEWPEAMKYRDAIVDELRARHLDVVVVPPGTLTMKLGLINSKHVDAAIEVHFNSDALRAGRGSETLYTPGSLLGHRLAVLIQKKLGPLCWPDRGVKEGWYRMDRPGVKDYAQDVEGDEVIDAFLSKTDCPAVIVEPFFIHELERIESARPAVCEAIADALGEFLE